MSSHHIVRDEQEPALLLWEPGQLTFEQAGELLEWSPRVIVHQQALEEALQWGIKLDAVWASPVLLEQVTAAVDHQQPVSVLPFSAEKPPLQEVLQWLKAINQRSLYLLANAENSNFSLLQQLEGLQQMVQVQVISHNWRYSYFSKGLAQKWFPADSCLRIVAFGEKPAHNALDTANPAEDQQLQELLVEQAGMVEVKGSAAFWLGEKL